MQQVYDEVAGNKWVLIWCRKCQWLQKSERRAVDYSKWLEQQMRNFF